MKSVFPDYENSLTNVSNSILKYFDIESCCDSLKELDDILKEKEYKNVILLLYDGMGSNLLDRNLGSDSFLCLKKVKNISSVFPATTTSCTTSVLSGVNPCTHGWLGWDLYYKELGKSVSMFRNTVKDTEEVIEGEKLSSKYFDYRTIIDKINEKYRAYELVPFGNTPYNNLEEMYKKIAELSKENGKKFIYAYSEEPDYSMHDFGTDAPCVLDLFRKIDEDTKKLCESLEDSIVIVIADHGHLNCDTIALEEYPDIFELLKCNTSIESRACAFFIKDEKNKEFEKLFEKYFGGYFKLYTKKEVIDNHLFGLGDEHPRFQESLGDYLAVAISNKCFSYYSKTEYFKSMHAGVTEDEMLVPLIIYKS